MASSDEVAATTPYAIFLSRSSGEISEDLKSYAQLLQKWQKVQNLVSRETLGDLWQRHFADSLQVAKLIGLHDQRFLDLGSGAGFPALPLAIAYKNTDRHFHLVEPNNRKASFLRTVARELCLPVTVHAVRSASLDSRETGPFHVVTSRALASLPALLTMAVPFLSRTSRAVFHKGREHGEEIAEARAHFSFDVVITASDTSTEGVLLEISDVRAAVKR